MILGHAVEFKLAIRLPLPAFLPAAVSSSNLIASLLDIEQVSGKHVDAKWSNPTPALKTRYNSYFSESLNLSSSCRLQIS